MLELTLYKRTQSGTYSDSSMLNCIVASHMASRDHKTLFPVHGL